jgi:hypothetical protein
MDFDSSSNRLSDNQLKWSEWLVNHKVLMYRIGIGTFAMIDLLLVGYGAYGFFDWGLGSGVQERARYAELSAQLTDYGAFRAKYAAQDLTLEGTVSVTNNDNIDFYTVMNNVNTEWWATFTYRYTNGSAASIEQQGFILPGQAKYLHALGAEGLLGSDAVIEVKNLRWHRVNKHFVRPDYASWSGERLNLVINNTQFTSPDAADAVKISRASFDVKNDSAFGYKRVGFFVAALSGGRPLAFTYVTISNLRAGESRAVDVSWVGDIGFAGQILAVPDINIFDENAYLAPGE